MAAFASAGWWIAAVVIYHFAFQCCSTRLHGGRSFRNRSVYCRCNCFGCVGSANRSARSCPRLALVATSFGRGLRRCTARPLSDSGSERSGGYHAWRLRPDCLYTPGAGFIVAATGHHGFVRPTLFGAVVGVLAIVWFYVVQRLGMFRFIGKIISRLASADDWHSLVYSGQTLDEGQFAGLYARRCGVLGCCLWTATSLILGSGEIWIALHALSLQATLVNAVILQSMVLTIRSAVFPSAGRPRRPRGRLRPRW